MSKKIISLMLAMALSASMVAVAAVSVSADTDSDGNYVPSEGTETYRYYLSLIHISEPTRQAEISYAVFCLKKKKKKTDG